jgi:hypothetical protein
MNGDEKSDSTIVAMKPENEPLRRGKEWMEPRVGAEGLGREERTNGKVHTGAGAGLRTGKPRQRGLIAYGKWHERRKGKGSPPYCTISMRRCCARLTFG